MEQAQWIEVSNDLETGICLWMGAGTTTHLGRAIGARVPGWGDLTADLEREASISSTNATASFPERLDECLNRLGGEHFRHRIARAIHGPLCTGLVRYAHDHRQRLSEIPDAAWQLGALGWRANPIVNFNVETFTSMLAARPAGACRILPFRLRANPADVGYEQLERGADFTRVVYHPHGAVNYTGDAVMTASEYAAHEGSLAYVLAVSAAFENNLWICGMSLDDAYLREALARYRRQIRNVRWFDSKAALAKHGDWARDNQVTCVAVDWTVFWQVVQRDLGPQTRRSGVMTAWFSVLDTAMAELLDGTEREQLAELAARIPALAQAALGRGSQGEYRKVFDRSEIPNLLPEGFSRRAIDDAIDLVIHRESAAVENLMELLVEKQGAAARDFASALELAKPARAHANMRHINL